MRKPLFALVAVLSLAILADSAGATNQYTPAHGKACKRGYVRRHRWVKRHGHRVRKRICVKRSHRLGATSKTVKLHAHLDPTYTRDPLDPFKVTYAYSASATQEVAAATKSSEEPALLPSGVLSLFSDGILECSINVGGQATGDECPVEYASLGQHKVTTIYTSGEQSATATEIESIEPLGTETHLALAYRNQTGGPLALSQGNRCRYQQHHCGFSCHFIPNGGAGEEECFFEQEWTLGELTITAGSYPAGAVSLQPLEGPSLNGERSVVIAMFAEGSGTRWPVGYQVPPSCEWMKEHAKTWKADRDHIELSATPIAAGYIHAAVTASLLFSPDLPC